MLVNENSTYFYDILPYTYVLGVSNKWIKKFESINVNPPTWYNYSDSIDIFMTSTMNTFNYIMTASPIKYNPSWDSKSSWDSSSSWSSSDTSSGGSSSGDGSVGGGVGAW